MGVHDSVGRVDGGVSCGGGCLPLPFGLHLVRRRFAGGRHRRGAFPAEYLIDTYKKSRSEKQDRYGSNYFDSICRLDTAKIGLS